MHLIADFLMATPVQNFIPEILLRIKNEANETKMYREIS